MSIVKTMEPQKGLQQVRHDKPQTFVCARCGQEKTAKLVAHSIGNPEELYCNGCYGWLLANG